MNKIFKILAMCCAISVIAGSYSMQAISLGIDKKTFDRCLDEPEKLWTEAAKQWNGMYFDKESGAWQYTDPSTGETFVVDNVFGHRPICINP